MHFVNGFCLSFHELDWSVHGFALVLQLLSRARRTNQGSLALQELSEAMDHRIPTRPATFQAESIEALSGALPPLLCISSLHSNPGADDRPCSPGLLSLRLPRREGRPAGLKWRCFWMRAIGREIRLIP